jgi:DNA-binding NarL/FixJ family response regulator
MAQQILLVEDDGPTRRYLARAVESHPGLELTGQAANCAEAIALLEKGAPDVLLTDLGLPDGSGIELIRALRKSAPDALAMVITALGNEKTVLAAVEAGATGYLLKDGSYEEIGEAVQCLIDGGSPISPSIARKLLRRMQIAPASAPGPAHAPAPDASPDADLPSLSPRETEVLRLIAKGFSFPEIAELLGISAHTVTTHVRRIYEKLEVGNRGSAVYEAVSLGLIRMDD